MSVLSNLEKKAGERLAFQDGTTCKGMTFSQMAQRFGNEPAAREVAERLVLADAEGFFAEMSAMRRYLDKRLVDTAYLIGTDTPECELAMRWLTKALEQRGVRVERGPAFVGYDDVGANDDSTMVGHDFMGRLQEIRAKTLAYLRRRQRDGDQIFIAAQGGYKPLTGVLMLVGAEMQATTYYVHEDRTHSVELPVLLYRGSVEPLQALKDAGPGGARGDRMRKLLTEHPELTNEAAKAYAVYVRRGEDDGIDSVELTGYGRFILELDAQEKG